MSENGTTPAGPGRGGALPANLMAGAKSGNSPKRDRVAEALARRLGILPESARQVLMSPVRFKVAEIIASFDDVQEYQRRERWLAPIRAAMENLAWEPYTMELRVAAEEADSEEDKAQTLYREDPTPANRERLIRAKLEQSTTSLAEAMALINEKRAEAA